jgi:8-hydroxy-5-deazaflavin:NADPH oxidoreductase
MQLSSELNLAKLWPSKQNIRSWKMKTAIIGVGNMGKGLARRLDGKTDLIVAGRDAASAAAFAATLNKASSASIAQAITAADIVVLAMPYGAALELASLPELAGKIVVDMSNPVKPDFSGLLLGHTTSAAEEIQLVAKHSKVVKAFNTIFAGLFGAPSGHTAKVPVFLAGNDEAAVEAVAALVSSAGFASEKTGALEAARLLEPMGMLNIRFGYGLGRGTAIAPNWLMLSAW